MRKWYFTPGGWIRAALVIGLLAGAAFVEGIVSTLMLVGGLLLLVYSWAVTFSNIRRINKEVAEAEKARLRNLDRETEEHDGTP